MKGNLKRLLAAFLSVIMIAGNVPTMLLTSHAAVGDVITYDFARPTTGVTKNGGDGTIVGITGQGDAGNYEITKSFAGSGWRINNDKTTAPLQGNGTTYTYMVSSGTSKCEGSMLKLWNVSDGRSMVQVNRGKSLAFDFTVPEAGTYSVQMGYTDFNRNTGATFDIYNGSADAALSGSFPATVYADATNSLYYVNAGTVTLQAGDFANTIVFTNNVSGYYGMALRSMVLTKVADAAQPTEAPTATPEPTLAPTATPEPTLAPTSAPTSAPSPLPTNAPGLQPFYVDASKVNLNTINQVSSTAWYLLVTSKGDNWSVNSGTNATHLSGNKFRVMKSGADPYAIQIGQKNGNLILDFTVPATGSYNVSCDVVGTTSSGYGEISIDGDLKATLLGYGSGENNQAVASVYLTAGDHTLSIKSIGGYDGGGNNFRWHSVNFIPVGYVAPTPEPTPAPTLEPTPAPTEDPNAVKEAFSVSAETVDLSSAYTVDETNYYFLPGTKGANWAANAQTHANHFVNGTDSSNRARIFLEGANPGRIGIYKLRQNLVLSFTAPASGYYSLSSNVYWHEKAGYADIFINDEYIGTLDGNKNSGYNVQELMNVYLKPGELANTLTIRATGASTGTSYYFLWKSFDFEPADAASTITGIDADLDTTALFEGDVKAISTKMVVGNEAFVRPSGLNYALSYASSDETVATVTTDGHVVAHKEGTATITASIPFSGFLDTIDITVTALAYESADINIEEGQEFMERDTLVLEPKAKLNSGAYAADNLLTTTYESSDEAVAKVEDGVLHILAEGTATITAHVTYDGKTLDAVRNITVEKYVPPVAFELHFEDLVDYLPSGSTSYLKPETTGTNWTISDKTDAPLAIMGEEDGEDIVIDTGRCRIFYGDKYASLRLFANQKTIVFNLDVAIPGDYDITANMTPIDKGGYATVHVNGEYVGTINSYLDESIPATQPLLGVHLKKGINEIAVKVQGVSQGTGLYANFRGFSFSVPADEIAKITAIDAKADVDNMYVGRKEQISVDAILSNGGFYQFSRSTETFTYESSNPAVATVSSTGLITGVSKGEATVTVKAVNSGLTDTLTFDVSDAAYDKVELNIAEGENFYVMAERELAPVATLADGTTISYKDLDFVYKSSNESVAKVEDGILKIVGKGTAAITVDATFKLSATTKSDTKNLVADTLPLTGITGVTEKPVVQELDFNGVQLLVKGIAEDGTIIDDFAVAGFTSYDFAYTSLTPEVLTIDANGVCHYVSRGNAQVQINAVIDGVPFEQVVDVVSSSQKTGRTYYTDDRVANARYNVTNYQWGAKVLKQKAGIAYEYVYCLDQMYDLIPSEGVPRSYVNATLGVQDSFKHECPVCHINMSLTEAYYNIDPLVEPWKIWCTNCQTRFPSNDFALLYQRGLDENGEYNRELAYQRNAEAVARGEKDALVNELYPERGATWMVDDGMGWSPTSGTYGTKDLVQYTPIAYYMYKWWYGQSKCNIMYALYQIRDYYLWTGDERFGRAGAILLDRVADVYPGYDLTKVSLNYQHSHGGGYSGKILGGITEAKEVVNYWATCYDAFYPMYDDPEVIAYLSRKAAEKGLANPKTSGNLIRENLENGLLRESFESAKEAKVYGNFGLQQKAIVLTAVVLDTQPETNEMFDWLNAPSTTTKKNVIDPIFGLTFNSRQSNTGGEMATKFVNEIDRDGFGGEISINYNNFWLRTAEIAEILENYDTSKIDLFANPKFMNMFESFIHMTGGGGGSFKNMGYSFPFGDGGRTASGTFNNFDAEMVIAYKKTRDPLYAQLFHVYNAGNFNNSQLGYYNDTKELTIAMQNDIATHGEYQMKSLNLTGYGLSIVRGGKAATKADQYETRYDTWMYYGRTTGSHAHLDQLHMGIDAYGFNFMPDFGNPEAKSENANRHEWVRNTISHNTVVVNESQQKPIYTGTPLHYDVTDNVKVIDNEAADAYKATDIYRRTAVTISANDDVAYTLDFFRVKGGNQHTYSFHSQSYKSVFTEDLDLTPQTNEKGEYAGTYAGIDVPYGPDPNSTDAKYAADPVYPRGYTWLTDVNRGKDKTGDGVFTVKFEQTNFNNQVVDAAGLAMNVHALNDWEPDSVDIMVGYPPRVEDNINIPGLDYMLIQRKGENLDTLFTTLLEPFKVDSYILKAEPWTVAIKEGTEGADDIVKAVKVTLKNGRTDYVVYATNNNVTYTVTDGDVSFDFAGFVGVYSVDYYGDNIFSYVNDGTIIGNKTSVGAYTGTVVDFTKELVFDDYILIDTDQEVEDVSVFENQYIYVDNDAKCNGAYRIISAEKQGDFISLYLGNCSLIDSYKDDYNLDAGFIYTIEDGQTFRIPVSLTAGVKFSGTNATPGNAGSASSGNASGNTTVDNVAADTTEDATEADDVITSSELLDQVLEEDKDVVLDDGTTGDEIADDATDGKDGKEDATTSTEAQSTTEGGDGTPTPTPDTVDANAGGKKVRNILLGGLGVLALGAGIFLILLGKKKEEDEEA